MQVRPRAEWRHSPLPGEHHNANSGGGTRPYRTLNKAGKHVHFEHGSDPVPAAPNLEPRGGERDFVFETPHLMGVLFRWMQRSHRPGAAAPRVNRLGHAHKSPGLYIAHITTSSQNISPTVCGVLSRINQDVVAPRLSHCVSRSRYVPPIRPMYTYGRSRTYLATGFDCLKVRRAGGWWFLCTAARRGLKCISAPAALLCRRLRSRKRL